MFSDWACSIEQMHTVLEDVATPRTLEAILYKGTTLPHIVVRRGAKLTPDGLATFQPDKNAANGKQWALHRRTTLEPPTANQIRAHERHLRKAGPLRALSSYARDKHVLKLYCFRIEWPDKHAPVPSSSLELGFDSLQQAQQWHETLTRYLQEIGRSSGGSLATVNEALAQLNSTDPSSFTSPVSSFAGTPNTLSKQPSMSGASDLGGASPSPPSPAMATGLPPDSSNSSSIAASHGHNSSMHCGTQQHHVDGHNSSSHSVAAVLQPFAGAAIITSAGGSDAAQQHARVAAAEAAAAAAAAETAEAARGKGQGGNSHHGHNPHSSTGVVVDECMMRWVPYKHANGMAIYYRQTPPEEGKGMPQLQASGEYMLSTAVQASPEHCVSNLMLKADKNGSILSTAAFMEVLEDNGDMQVWHMVFHPAGSAGLATVLAAPRYTFLHQVLTSYEEGVYAVLFSSVPDEDIKPEWIERANARTQRAHRAVLRSDPGSGSRRPLWRKPVHCKITGAITMSALEGKTGRDSPQTLVTCIIRADFGGWLGSKSPFYSMAQALGLQEALMDRVLMRVMILKEDVEYSRFKTKPFQLLMLQPEDYEGTNDSSSSGNIPSQQRQRQRAMSMPLSAGSINSKQGSGVQQHQVLQPSRKSGSGGQPGSPSSIAAASAAGGDLVSRTQSAATAAAARVSAAASALAAHMTNPQQLWHEKRISTAGLSGASTPPHSPHKHSAPTGGGPSSPFGFGARQQHHFSDSGVAKAAAGKGPGSLLSIRTAAALAQQQRQKQQQQQQTGAAGIRAAADGSDHYVDAVSGIAPAPAADADDSDVFHSTTGSSANSTPLAAAAGSAAAAAGRALAAAAAADRPSTSPAGQSAGDSNAVATTSSSSVDSNLYPYTPERLQELLGGSLNRQYWEPIHDGVSIIQNVYSLRGPNYLKDRKKIPAGKTRYRLLAADLVATDHMMDHIGRFLPSVRCNGAAFSFVVDLIINYGSPVLHLVMVFGTDRHPNSLGPCPDDPLDAGDEWTPFDFAMSRFLHASNEERNGMFKLVPHCAKGSWIVSQSVGTTPVILGRKLATTYHQCDRYIEVDVDVASTQAVAYIVKMVQGATRSMLIDHAYLLEGQYQHELPETLIGAIRYKHLDMTDYTHINVDRELPFTPVVPGIVGQ